MGLPAGDPDCLHIPGLTVEKGNTYTLVVSDKDDLDAVLPVNVVHHLKVCSFALLLIWFSASQKAGLYGLGCIHKLLVLVTARCTGNKLGSNLSQHHRLVACIQAVIPSSVSSQC